jgi:hypothetical protein
VNGTPQPAAFSQYAELPAEPFQKQASTIPARHGGALVRSNPRGLPATLRQYDGCSYRSLP